MRIWPIILDSKPAYLQGDRSFLLLPLGRQTVIEYLVESLAGLTPNAPLVFAEGREDEAYAAAISAAAPAASVARSAEEVAHTVAGRDLSDVLLLIDAQMVPLRGDELGGFVRGHAEDPRLTRHLIAFERSVAGTSERVNFDAAGQVRSILRHYEPSTWPFIAGVSATMLPVASGALSDGTVPRTLAEMRSLLASHGVTGQDVAIQGGCADLSTDTGLLAANEYFVRRASANSRSSAPILVGGRHYIDRAARIAGPVVLHAGVRIEAGAIVVGPTVLGAGVHVASGSTVAQAVVVQDASVDAGQTVRSMVWNGEKQAATHRSNVLSYEQRLAQLSAEAKHEEAALETTPRGDARTVGKAIKRAIDVAASGAALIVLSPLLLLAGIAVWLESGGPIFYGDRREGMGGRPFKCWKFRTMFVGADSAQTTLKAQDHTDGPHFKIDRDPRVSQVGKLLRATNVDELPQLFNVLTGTMSLVGPRPSPFRENQICIPWREGRLSVRPGITGLWQLCRHNRSAGDFHQWIEYDLLYVERFSLWLDVRILTATALTLGGKLGRVQASWLVPRPADNTVSARHDSAAVTTSWDQEEPVPQRRVS